VRATLPAEPVRYIPSGRTGLTIPLMAEPMQRAARPLGFVYIRLAWTLCSFSSCFLGGCNHVRPEASIVQSLSPLEVRVASHARIETRVGDPVTVTVWLENTGAKPLTVAHGPRLLILEAFANAATVPPTAPARLVLPPADSWGRITRLEYPNPGAIYTTPLITAEISPQERYGTKEFRISFDSVGTYTVRPCANLISRFTDYANEIRICSLGGLTVAVRP
jgi:hypothetical protein